MPTFVVTGPDGARYNVTGPEGATEQDALAQVQTHLAQQAPPQIGTAEDIAKSAGTGLVKGVTGTLGAGGDLQSLAAKGAETSPVQHFIDWLKSVIPDDPQSREYAQKMGARGDLGPTFPLPTSEQLQSLVERLTGPLHKPQTTPGKYAETIGEFAPAAVGGAGGAMARAARVAAPGVASEAAGQATEGTGFEPWARVVGALAGGAAGSAIGALPEWARGGKIGAASVAPTRQEIQDAAKGDYAVARAMDVNVKPDAVQKFAGSLQSDLESDGLRDYLAPKTFSALREMQNPAPGSVANLADLEGMRRVLGNAARDFANPNEQMASSRAIKSLDKYLVGLNPSDVISGDLSAAQRVLGDARANWSAAKLSETIDKKQIKAELRASAANSGMNVANTMRSRMADILLNPKELSGFTGDERSLMERIVRGTKPANAIRYVGNLLGGGGGLGGLTTAAMGGMATLPEGGIGALAPLVGGTLKTISNASTLRDVRKLDEMIRARSPLAQSRVAASAAVPAPAPNFFDLLRAQQSPYAVPFLVRTALSH